MAPLARRGLAWLAVAASLAPPAAPAAAGTPFCCTAAIDNSSQELFCSTCYEGARNDQPGAFCSASEQNCRGCGQQHAWCDAGTGSAAPPAEATASGAAGAPAADAPPQPEASTDQQGAGLDAVGLGDAGDDSFCCMSAADAGDVCGSCWAGSRVFLGYCGVSSSRCRSCGKVWCVLGESGEYVADLATTADGSDADSNASSMPTATPTPTPEPSVDDGPGAADENASTYTRRSSAFCHESQISDTLENVRSDCQSLCDTTDACRGYSWEQQKGRCILTRRPENISERFLWWDCYTKAPAEVAALSPLPAGKPGEKHSAHRKARARTTTTTTTMHSTTRGPDAAPAGSKGRSATATTTRAAGGANASAARAAGAANASAANSSSSVAGGSANASAAKAAAATSRATGSGHHASANATVAAPEGFCCLKAHSGHDACGSCYKDARVGPEVYCGRSATACRSCGKAWCGADAGSSSSTPTPTTTSTTATPTTTTSKTSTSTSTTSPPPKDSCAAQGCQRRNATLRCHCDVECIGRQDCCADFLERCVERLVMKKFAVEEEGGPSPTPAWVSVPPVAAAALASLAAVGLVGVARRLGNGSCRSVCRTVPLVAYHVISEPEPNAASHELGFIEDSHSEWEPRLP